MRVHRLISILMKIDQESKVKAHDMAEALEVSRRTIYRDIDVWAFLCYGQILYPEEMKLRAREILESSINV